MEEFDLYEYYKDNKNNNIILSFKGAVSQEILVEIGQIIRNKFGVDKSLKKIFSVFVEMSQNIMHYSSERVINPRDGKDVGVGIILFKEYENSFLLTSGNQLRNSIGQRVTSKIDKINELNKDELKELYIEQRRKPQEDESKGAGLGLIEIARKSAHKINYKITEINDESSFLVMNVKFNKEQSNE